MLHAPFAIIGSCDRRNADREPESLPDEYLRELRELEEHYLAHDDPIRQSGFSGGEERWKNERGIILDAVDEDGSFLDVGCANGYLLECLV